MVEVLAMATWFSATAIVPSLDRAWGLDAGGAAWLGAAVPAGFVLGSLVSAAANLPDRIAPRILISASACAAATANLALLAAGGLALALPVRFLVGVALAGVYPPGMKLVATHFRSSRGLAIGVVIGALTLGSASPHLVRGASGMSWQAVIAVTSALALLAALLILGVREGPHAVPAPPLDPRFALRAARDRPLRLATIGYLGHMWELYAFWTWLPAFLVASTASAGAPIGRLAVGAITFGVIGVAGLAGAVLAGHLADRVGRTAVTSAAMTASAACCALSPLAFGRPIAVLLPLLVVWGAAVIADSGQFSAAATELAEPGFSGSALTLQTALGFLLTIASIRLVPVVADAVGWRFALTVLAAGPVLGTIAMLRLRRMPQATLMAGGRR